MSLRLGFFVALAALVGAAPLMGGCAGAELEGRASALRGVIETARRNGAYRCAPRELAMAESHRDFGEQELAEGDYYRAKEELAVADLYAHHAIRKSPRSRCATEVAAAETPRDLVVQRLDTDKDGLFDDEDGCPKEPEDKDGFQDEDGCPEPDNDDDGILDAADHCPQEPEDKDSFQDDDGCPEEDNDKDSLADAVDQCPNDPEDKDGYQDDDGCPDPDNDGDKIKDGDDRCPNEYALTADGCPQKYQLIVVTREKIELKQTIFFDYKKSTIKPVSYPLLNEVAQALGDNPTIKVRVEGHTDSRGSDTFNLRLSQARAESVREYLIGQKIAPERMDAKGFGETVPIADNRTAKGRDMNRRVEFVITSQ